MFHKTIRVDLTDELRKRDPAQLLDFYDGSYFLGRSGGDVYGYYDYADCRWILDGWSKMLEERFAPDSILDVGAAYGFVVEHFRLLGRRADGVEPSAFARARSNVELAPGSLPDDLPTPQERYDVVTCTEVLEHVHPELVPRALAALTAQAARAVVCLVEMGEWDAYHEDPSHIHLRPRDWWMDAAAGVEGATLDQDSTAWLDAHPMSRQIGWRGRFLVFQVDGAGRLPSAGASSNQDVSR